jgi:hypothetical protein
VHLGRQGFFPGYQRGGLKPAAVLSGPATAALGLLRCRSSVRFAAGWGGAAFASGGVFGAPRVELGGAPEQRAADFAGLGEAAAFASHEVPEGASGDAEVGGCFVAGQVTFTHNGGV